MSLFAFRNTTTPLTVRGGGRGDGWYTTKNTRILFNKLFLFTTALPRDCHVKRKSRFPRNDTSFYIASYSFIFQQFSAWRRGIVPQRHLTEGAAGKTTLHQPYYPTGSEHQAFAVGQYLATKHDYYHHFFTHIQFRNVFCAK